MRAPAFWQRGRVGAQALLLQPLALIYGAIAAREMARPGVQGTAPILCIGNFTLGGTGKTPAALALAQMLRDMGEVPAFLSRGYGGTLSGPEPLQVDPSLHEAADVGDEPLLLARHAPAFICTDRIAGAEAAARAGASVVVMDDGLQNPSLEDRRGRDRRGGPRGRACRRDGQGQGTRRVSREARAGRRRAPEWTAHLCFRGHWPTRKVLRHAAQLRCRTRRHTCL